MSIDLVVEGDTDLPVARKLAASAKLEIGQEIDCGGKDLLDRGLQGYNQAARGSPWLVLRDLDDLACAPAFLAAKLKRPARWMCLRLAVRETEAWLLADGPGIARFLGVQESLIPAHPDALVDPVAAIVALARRSSDRRIREGMVPPPGHRREVGITYEDQLIDFGTRLWSLDRACKRSDSLARARRAIGALAREWRKRLRGGDAP